MDGAARAAGVGATISLAGRTFQVKGRTVGFQAALEAEILRLRGDPLEKMVEAARSVKEDPKLLDRVAMLFAERFRNWGMANHSDYDEFLRTPRGQAFSIWWAIKHNDKPPTLQQVEFWVGELAGEYEMQDVEVTKEDGTKEAVKRPVNTGWRKIAEILQAIDFASGEDALGNSIGPS